MTRAARTPFAGSFLLHLLVLLIVSALRQRADAPSSARDDTAAPPLVYVHARVAGGGGGGGGERRAAPMQRAQARGDANQSSPIRPPSQPSPQPAPLTLDVDAPEILAVSAYAATQYDRGLIDAQLPFDGARGAGEEQGAGGGKGPGVGDSGGDGVGSGGPHGVGGGIYVVGGGVTAPTPVFTIRPQYTTAAMSARIGGVAVVDCVVMPDGSVGEVRVIRSLDAQHGLDDEAIRAVRRWRFRPGLLDGRPVAVRVTIELFFSIY